MDKQYTAGTAKSTYSNRFGSGVIEVPTYGGDCAIAPEDGITSAATRLREIVRELNSATWSLRDFFGMNVPECGNQEVPRPSGHKYDIDEMVISARASLDNVQLVLTHLRS